jgi:dihydroneopterin aldolase
MSMAENMSSDMRWRINIKNLETHIAIGLHDHEKTPQRIIVNAAIDVLSPAKPTSIKQCFNYDHVHKLVVGQWPQRSHVQLLETCVTELLEYIFRADDRVVFAKASVCKPDIFSEAESVGVEAEWTLADFERLAQKKL